MVSYQRNPQRLTGWLDGKSLSELQQALSNFANHILSYLSVITVPRPGEDAEVCTECNPNKASFCKTSYILNIIPPSQGASSESNPQPYPRSPQPHPISHPTMADHPAPPPCKYLILTYPLPFVAHVEINRPEKMNAFKREWPPPFNPHHLSLCSANKSTECGKNFPPSSPTSPPPPPPAPSSSPAPAPKPSPPASTSKKHPRTPPSPPTHPIPLSMARVQQRRCADTLMRSKLASLALRSARNLL